MKHELRRFFQKTAIQLIKSFRVIDKQPVHQHQRDAIDICIKAIMDPDSTMLISPLSGKKYIKNDKFAIYVILNQNVIHLINHNYQYMIQVTDKQYDQVLEKFNKEVERRRSIFEKEITSNVTHSIKNILNKMS
jgi:hypothetical protein